MEEGKIMDSVVDMVGQVPNCFKFMQGKVIDYTAEESLTVSFPVQEEYLNPAGSMQGGFITAAFDNVFGPLSGLVSKGPTTTINLETSYQRPIFAGDELIVTAAIRSKGRTLIHMVAEAFNGAGKLVATASSNYIVLHQQ